jgi:hypothetical protein
LKYNLTNKDYRILKNGSKYPGKHNHATMRATANGNLKPIQPHAQFIIIWKSFMEYIEANVRAGRSVNVKGFGCFTFSIETELPKIASRGFSPRNISIWDARAERKNIHHVKPVFVVDPDL